MCHRFLFAASGSPGFLLVLVVALGLFVVPACAQPAGPVQPVPTPSPSAKVKPKEIPLIERLRSPYEEDRPLAEKLRSPRETLKTLYFAVITYDLFPEMIEDAVACLDVDGLRPRSALQDAAMLALGLENALNDLALPLSNVPDQAAGEAVLLHDADGITLAMRRGPDGGWRFDAQTLERLPVMLRVARLRRQQRAITPASLREGFSDPRATLRQFVLDLQPFLVGGASSGLN